MRYRNTVTGAIIDVDAVLTGGNWEAAEKPPQKPSARKPEKTAGKSPRRTKVKASDKK